jgi:trigger factor
MKKTKLFVSAAILAMAMMAAACGKKAETKESEKASSSEVASESTLTEDSPEIKELEALKVPAEPKLAEMGSITLPDLKSITVTVEPAQTVTQEEVDDVIQRALDANPDVVDDVSKEGDTVNIDYSGSIDGVKFDGGTAEKQDLKLGSGQFIPGFEDQLIGKKAGEEVTVKVTFPEEYGNEELAGKDAEFAVKIHEVKRPATLSDEWVKNYKETTANTIAEYREEVRKQLQARKDFNYHSNIQELAIQQISEQAKIEPSEKLMEYAKAYLLDASLSQMKSYGLSVADIVNMSGKSVAEFKEEAYARAEDYAKQLFLMRKLAADQGIKATDALLDELAEAESSLTGEKTNRIKLIEQYGKELVEEAAIRNAVMEYVESQITVKNEESSVIFEQDAKDSATENKSTTKAAEEESVETSEEDSTSATVESKKAE